MDEFKNLPTITQGIYEHYKGKRYQVLGVGRHTEVDEYYVVYSPLYEHEGQPDIWIRPYDMFVSNIELDGVMQPRFKKEKE